MEQNSETLINKRELENFFINSNIDIDFGNFFIAILLSLILAYVVKFTYIKVGRALNDKDYFSDTFVPLAIITTLVITVIKFSLALSLGLVGALSIVRFRAAIKEPEELVYLFFVISIGLANGANQFVLSVIATIIIVAFLFLRNIYQNKNKSDYQFNADSNILNINILDNSKKNIDSIINQLKPDFKYLKLKSANIEQNKSSYVFWYDLEDKKIGDFLNNIKKICDENLDISIYSKTGAYE